MSILADKNAKVLIQGIKSEVGIKIAVNMMEMGTNVVGGVTPGKGGDWILNGKLPVFDSLKTAIETTNAYALVIAGPSDTAYDAMCEGIENLVPLMICITEGIPQHDIIRVKHLIKHSDTFLIGPNSPGIFSPGETMIGIVPKITAAKGNVGVITRSGTLGYEVMNELSNFGVGISTFIGLGADPIIATKYSDILPFYQEDPDTEKIIIIDEYFGEGEKNAVDFISLHFSKPVVGMVVGNSSPANGTSSRAGVSKSEKTRKNKPGSQGFQDIGALIATTIEDLPKLILQN